MVGSGGFALAVLGACLLRVPHGDRVGGAAAAGRWARCRSRRTSRQLVVWAAVADAVLGDTGDLAGFRDLEPFGTLTLGAIVLCTAWALLVGRGPLEWALDRSARLVVRARA